jgi:hypothetical protein
MVKKTCYYFLATMLLLLLGFVAPVPAAPLAITPFYTVNQSPMAQIFGLPAAESATIQAPGHLWSLLAFDMANNYANYTQGREQIVLDGESYRTTLALRYGVLDELELGVDLPFTGYDGGVLDGAIEAWHGFFGLPQGGRLQAPNNRLLFSYSRDNQERLRLDRSNFGLGDLRLGAGWQMYHDHAAQPRALALRASLKLPTGASSKLRGSGSTDFALWLTGSDDYLLPGSWGHLTLFGAGGALALTNGRVLEEQQNNLVGFGTLGLGWAPAQWIALKTQLALHSPFFTQSELSELGKPTVQLVFGGTLALASRTALDIGVSEDVSVGTSPDFAIHLGLSHQF